MVAAVTTIVFVLALGYAALRDLMSYEIPNWIPLVIVVDYAALALLGDASLATVGQHVAVGLVVLAIGAALFFAHVLGGGDAKLLAACALWFGWPQFISFTYMVALSAVVSRSSSLRFSPFRLPLRVTIHRCSAGCPLPILASPPPYPSPSPAFSPSPLFPLPPQDPIGIGIFLRVETTFSLTSKDLDATIYCQSDWFDCFRVLCEVIGGDGLSTNGVSIYGLQFQTTFPGGVSVRTDTSFSEEKNASLTGYSDYFERFRLSGPTESCCGSPGRWQIRTYFQSTSTTLFDWGMTSISATEVLTDAVRFSIGLNFRAAAPIWQITIGWQVNW